MILTTLRYVLCIIRVFCWITSRVIIANHSCDCSDFGDNFYNFPRSKLFESLAFAANPALRVTVLRDTHVRNKFDGRARNVCESNLIRRCSHTRGKRMRTWIGLKDNSSLFYNLRSIAPRIALQATPASELKNYELESFLNDERISYHVASRIYIHARAYNFTQRDETSKQYEWRGEFVAS